jgi:hypothetical protein
MEEGGPKLPCNEMLLLEKRMRRYGLNRHANRSSRISRQAISPKNLFPADGRAALANSQASSRASSRRSSRATRKGGSVRPPLGLLCGIETHRGHLALRACRSEACAKQRVTAERPLALGEGSNRPTRSGRSWRIDCCSWAWHINFLPHPSGATRRSLILGAGRRSPIKCVYSVVRSQPGGILFSQFSAAENQSEEKLR